MSAERGHLESQNQAGPVSKTDPIRTCQIRLIGFGPRAFPSNTPLTGACPNFLHTQSRSLSHHRTRRTSRHQTSLECLNDLSKVPFSNTHIEQTQTLQLETRRRTRWRRWQLSRSAARRSYASSAKEIMDWTHKAKHLMVLFHAWDRCLQSSDSMHFARFGTRGVRRVRGILRTWITPICEDLDKVARARLVSNILDLMDGPSSFTTSGGMYTIESLHYSLDLDVLKFISVCTAFGGFPGVHCAAQTAVRGAFQTSHPVPRGDCRYYHARFDKLWGHLRVVNLEYCLLTPGSAFATGYRSPTIEPPSSFPGRPPPQNAHCCSRIVDHPIPLFLVLTLDQYRLQISLPKPNVRSSIPFLRERRGLPVSHRIDR